MDKYCILGNDKRNNNLRQMYKEEGIEIVAYEFADIVIAPIPFSKDDIKINGEILQCSSVIDSLEKNNATLYSGAISNNIKEILNKRNIKYYDLLDFESVAILNAIPTAEGAIEVAMQNTDFTLNGSNVLVLGYGKIGKILSKMLAGIGSKIYCEARKEKDIALIQSMGYNSIKLEELEDNLSKMDVIFNTIPSMILDEKRLKLLKKKCSIIDLASSPGGVDFASAKELGINVVWALALPTKVAPYTAATYIKDTIDKIEK